MPGTAERDARAAVFEIDRQRPSATHRRLVRAAIAFPAVVERHRLADHWRVRLGADGSACRAPVEGVAARDLVQDAHFFGAVAAVWAEHKNGHMGDAQHYRCPGANSNTPPAVYRGPWPTPEPRTH